MPKTAVHFCPLISVLAEQKDTSCYKLPVCNQFDTIGRLGEWREATKMEYKAYIFLELLSVFKSHNIILHHMENSWK